MPRKYQSGKLQVRKKGVKRAYYFIRVSVQQIGEDGNPKTNRPREILGYCDEITKAEAMERRAAVLDAVNSHRLIAQSQVRFKDLVRRFEQTRIPQLGVATQAKYKTQLRLHILPAFGELRLCEIDRPRVEQWLQSKSEAGLGWSGRQRVSVPEVVPCPEAK